MKKRTKYTISLTEKDRISVSFEKEKGKILKFSIECRTRVEGRWKVMVRVDNSHEGPHIHTYHLQGRENRVKITGGNNDIFTAYKKQIFENFEEIKENFMSSK